MKKFFLFDFIFYILCYWYIFNLYTIGPLHIHSSFWFVMRILLLQTCESLCIMVFHAFLGLFFFCLFLSYFFPLKCYLLMGLILFLSCINLFDTEIEMIWIEGGKGGGKDLGDVEWGKTIRRYIRLKKKKRFSIKGEKENKMLKI